jgi:flagellar M-ring protein FliF
MADTPSNNMIANLARSGRVRIAAALVVTALVGGGLGVIMLRGDAGGQALLFSGLDLQEAADMTDRLDTAGVKYTLEGGGSAIFVDRAQVDNARMMLSEQGLPTRGSVGWEIFDKTEALGATTFVQNINRVRALEGELARTIASLDIVREARVHLSLPERPLFQRDAQAPKASVVLGLTGNSMTPEKVRAIRNLVATSVPGLAMEQITIIDDKGRLLAAGAESDDGLGGAGGVSVDERKLALENSYRMKILEIVESVAGPGAALVQVSVEADFNRVTSSAETYDPDGRVLRSSSTTEDTSRNSDMAPGDETTVANNVPTGEPAAADPMRPTSQSESNSLTETVNYEISKSVRTEVVEGPRIQRLSVAVAVDHKRIPGVDGAPATYEALPQQELDRILALVRSSVGYNAQRGDEVTVENIPFSRPEVVMEDAVAPGPFDFDKFDAVRAAEIAALLVTALALVFFVMRPLVRGLMSRNSGDDDPAAALDAPSGGQRSIPHGMTSSESGQQLTMQGGRTVTIDIPSQDRLDAGIDVARISGQVKASSIKKVSEVVSSHPEESLAIIRSWLAEEGSDRAA